MNERTKLQPVMILRDNTLRESASGRAYMPRFKTPNGKVIEISIGKSIATINNIGLLCVEPWLMQKRDGLAFAIQQGFESLDGTIIGNEPETSAQPVQLPANPNTCDIKKGFFTVERDGERHLTFRLKTNRKGQTIIGVMHGSNNLFDYIWFGFATNAGINFWRQANSGYRMPATLPITRDVAIDCFRAIQGDPNAAGQMYARESQRCARCNRVLTNPESLNNHFGPECVNFQFG